MTLSLADLASLDPTDDVDQLDLGTVESPTRSELLDLRRFLQIGLEDLTADLAIGADGDGAAAPLRLTKGRVRTTAICPAQVLAETNPFGINFNIAVGIVCDAAAGILALHPAFAPADGWYPGLRASLAQEHPHLIEYVDGLDATDSTDFHHVVDDLCSSLPELLGDLRPHRPTVHHRIAFVPVPGVHITGEVDMSVDVGGRSGGASARGGGGGSGCGRGGGGSGRGRVLAEVKSGRFNPRISDELAHYALITLLRDLGDPADAAPFDQPPEAPVVIGCSVSLGDLAVTPVPIGIEMLETSAKRLLETTKSLLGIDEAMRAGPDGPGPATNPGDHCRWCRRVDECGDAPDLVLAERTATLRPLDAGFDDAVAAGQVDDDPPWTSSGDGPSGDGGWADG